MNRLNVLLIAAATVLAFARSVGGQNSGEIAMTGSFIGAGPWARATEAASIEIRDC